MSSIKQAKEFLLTDEMLKEIAKNAFPEEHEEEIKRVFKALARS